MGIELASDGSYTVLLYDQGSGTILRGSGIDYTGSWHVGMEGGELLLIVPDSDTSAWYLRPEFTEEPRQLRFDEAYYLFHWSRYVPITLE